MSCNFLFLCGLVMKSILYEMFQRGELTKKAQKLVSVQLKGNLSQCHPAHTRHVPLQMDAVKFFPMINMWQLLMTTPSVCMHVLSGDATQPVCAAHWPALSQFSPVRNVKKSPASAKYSKI